MTTRDDDLEPRLGRVGFRDTDLRSHYLRALNRDIARAGRRPGASGSRRSFQGNRIGRGAGVGAVLASRDRYAAFRTRRVVIKTRLIRLAGHGLKSARAHLRYLQRDGVTREGLPGDLYDATVDRADGAGFLDRCNGDRHQFRFIVSPEDAIDYPDLKHFTRRLMRQMEDDLGTKLDWVAVDHYNTGHPHSHIVLRGKDDRGKDLVIARDYLSRGTRERAAEIVTLDLGPRTDRQIEMRLRDEVEQERFTSLDRSLLREAGADGIVRSGTVAGDAFRQTLRAGRLQKLRCLGLADEVAPSQWRLAGDLEPVLRRLGEQGDIVKTMHRALRQEGLARGAGDLAIYDPAAPDAARLVGRIVSRGLSDEMADRHYLALNGVDGRTHYVDIGLGEAVDPIPQGAIVAIEPKRIEPRAVDRTIAEIAVANGGRYSLDIHLRHDPSASAAFAETHLRRLEAMRRAGVAVEREPDGTWIIAPDHLDQARAYEREHARTMPVVVQSLSFLPLDCQVGADGATWLDRELIADAAMVTRDAGFGREVRDALVRRQQCLIEQGLAHREQDRIVYSANLLALLRRRELTRVAADLSGELGLPYREITPGQRIEGMYRRRIDFASGRFALIEKEQEFTLVPWRPVLERNLGKPVAGIARGEGISWDMGRRRGGPTIS